MTRKVDRREALTRMTGAWMAGAWMAETGTRGAPFVGRAFRKRQVDRIVVVGAGVLGAATAYRLATRGAHVVLCEKNEPASGASGKSGAWLNAYATKLPRHYYELSHQGTLEWRVLEDAVPGLDVNWCGRVEWRPGPDRSDDAVAAIARQQAWGYPIESLDADALAKIAPLLRTPELLSMSVYARGEGTVHPTKTVMALVEAASTAGVDVRLGWEMTAIRKTARGVTGVDTNHGTIEADAVVIAAGVDTPGLAALADVHVPLQDAPGVLAHGRTPTDPRTPIIVGPDVVLIPYSGGEYRFLGGFTGEIAYSSEKPASERLEAERVIAIAKERFRGMEQLELTNVTVGWRPLPIDGHPIIGFPERAPGVYVMVTHSGFTLAATLSRLAASEILDGVRADRLAPYRVERFA